MHMFIRSYDNRPIVLKEISNDTKVISFYYLSPHLLVVHCCNNLHFGASELPILKFRQEISVPAYENGGGGNCIPDRVYCMPQRLFPSI